MEQKNCEGCGKFLPKETYSSRCKECILSDYQKDEDVTHTELYDIIDWDKVEG